MKVENGELKMKRYQVIYADPPWSYSQKGVGRGNKFGAIDKYETMHLDDIKKMPINALAAEHAMLFIWGTVPMLAECLAVLNEWGFKYKTKITWEKTGILGMGNWLRIQEEYILVGIKGKPKPSKMTSLRNIVRHKVLKHSQKPEHFRDIITQMGKNSLGEINCLELFARERAAGWDVFGNEVEGSITINSCNHVNKYHFHENAPAYCPDCKKYLNATATV